MNIIQRWSESRRLKREMQLQDVKKKMCCVQRWITCIEEERGSISQQTERWEEEMFTSMLSLAQKTLSNLARERDRLSRTLGHE